MSGYTFKTEKDQADWLDYVIDYTTDLHATEPPDVIKASAWRVEGKDLTNGLTVTSDDHTATAAIVWVDGGEKTQRYRLINTVNTVGNRRFERTIMVEITPK